MASFYVIPNGANSTVVNTATGEVVFSGPLSRAESQAAELNRQASSLYDPNTTVQPTALTPDQQASVAAANATTTGAVNSNTTLPISQQDPSSTTLPMSAQDPFAFDETTPANQALLRSVNPSYSVTQNQQNYRPNPLDDYDSYTYNLSLHAVSIEQFNAIINNPAQSYIPQNVLVASAGRYNANFKRNRYFTEDFFFDDLKMTTIVNTTVRNKNSNLIELSFTLIEPNGFTFINRLMDALYDNSVGSKNYLAHPYILQIDFFGYQDGNINSGPIKNMSKVIPIKLTSLKSKVTTKGTEYRIDAVPFNHQAFSQVHNASPADFTVKAVTVKDLFGSGGVIVGSNLVQATEDAKRLQREEAAIRESLQTATSDTVISSLTAQLNSLQTQRASQGTGSFQVSGFCDALNSWWKELKDRKQIVQVNQFFVEFDKEIGDANLVPNPNNAPVPEQQVASQGSTTQDQKAAIRQAAGYSSNKIIWNSQSANIPAGTTITNLIDYAVRNSDYIRKQLKDPTVDVSKFNPLTIQSDQLKAPLKWYRVVPKITINNYDPQRESYGLTIVFNVKPWYVNSKLPYAPQGRIPGYVKKYDYIFTGQNKDVIDLSIDFDMMYYVQLTALRNKERIMETGAYVGDKTLKKEDDGSPSTSSDMPNGQYPTRISDPLMPIPTSYVSNDITLSKRSGSVAAGAQTAADLQKSMMGNARGDMINIKMRIIGDPEFIKQDDIFYNQSIEVPTTALTPNNSLYMDGGELYVFVNFQSPTDYDETTGLAVPGYSKYSKSQFSGIYKIITVENNFSRGKFEQTLDLVKLPIPDNLRDLNTNVQLRVDTYLNQALGQVAAAGSSQRFTGPSILQRSVSGGLTPIYNAAIAGTAAGGLIQGLAGQATQLGMSAVSQLASKYTQQAISYLKDSLNLGTFSNNPADYKVFEPTQSDYGAFGEAPTAPAAANPADFGADTADSFNSLATDTTLAESADALAIDDLSISDGIEGAADWLGF